MAGDEKKEAQKKTDEPSPQPEKETAGKEKPQATPAETAHADLNLLREKIETEKKEKQTRLDFLKKESSTRRNRESWVKNKPDEGIGSSIVKRIINSSVEDKFQAYIPQFQENGLGDPTNVDTIKQAAKDIIYDYYIKNGTNQDKTLEYVKNTLGEKLKFIFSSLQQIFKNKKFSFSRPIDCLEGFSGFCNLDFIKSGYVQFDALKTALLLEKSDYDFMLKSFEQSLNIGLDLHRISGEETNVIAQKTATVDIAALLKEGKIRLRNTNRFVVPPSASETESALRKTIYEQLPGNTDLKMKDSITAYLVGEAKKLQLRPGDTLEIAIDGSMRKIDLGEEEQQKKKIKQEAEAQLATAEPQAEGNLGKFGESLLKFLQNLMLAIQAVFEKIGMQGETEFALLDESEKAEALDFKKTCEQKGLNLETLHPLFLDAGQTRKILKLKKEKKLSWEDYLKKYLTDDEEKELKKTRDMKSEKIAEMFLNPKEPEKTGITMV